MRRHGLAAALAALVLLAGCSSSEEDPAADSPDEPSPSASATPTQATEAPRPEERDCYDVTYDEALAPTVETAPTTCEQEHTLRTYAVGDLDLVLDGHLLAIDSDRAQQQPADRCPERLGEFLGGDVDDLRLTVLRPVWFTPTLEESDAGASWYRCDVIALARDGRLAPLTGRLEGVLTRPEEAEPYRLCATAEPGTDGFGRVACSEEHSWRALSVVPLAEQEDYPGADAVSTAGEGPCEDAAREAAGDPLNFRWGYEWPSAEQWADGQRYGVCWTPA